MDAPGAVVMCLPSVGPVSPAHGLNAILGWQRVLGGAWEETTRSIPLPPQTGCRTPRKVLFLVQSCFHQMV